METAVQQFNTLPTTPQQVEAFAEKLRTELNSGIFNPLDLLVAKKAIDSVFEIIKDDLKTNVETEASKWAEKSFSYHGVTITKGSKSTYDYSVCKHPEYDRLTKRIKELEAYLKTLSKSTPMLDEETGELITINPPLKKVSDFVSAKI